MILEICVDSLQSALIAQEAGADRIELCSALEIGGLTPSWGLLKQVRQQLQIRLHVLIRPRGGDFCYSEAELAVMLDDIQIAKELGADGVVIGALNPNGSINTAQCQQMIQAARPLSVTFHRAFDFCPDPFSALQSIITLGVERILSSGQEPTALQGAPLLRQLILEAAGRIIVMPGAGINANNAGELVQKTGAREIHLSASSLIPSRMSYQNPRLSLLSPPLPENSLRQASFWQISAIRSLFS